MDLETETIEALRRLDDELVLLIAVTDDPASRRAMLERVRDNAHYAREKLRAWRAVREG